MANERARRDAQVGLIAASDYVVSKQIFNRQAPPPASAARFRAPNLGDVPRLFSGQEEDDSSWEHRIARLSAAALMYSADKENLRQADRLLRGSDSDSKPFEERALLRQLHRVREGHFATDRSCPHCRLLYSSLYRDKLAPIQVVHHSKDAKIDVDFDPDTCISEGKVKNFQAIVPRWVAEKMIDLAHPLDWANSPGTFFKKITAVQADGSRMPGSSPKDIKATWEEQANKGPAYILEDVEWPINQNLRSNAENILKITDFAKNGDGSIKSITYDYSLQRCVRTNFGVAWEPSGFDIDGGRCECSRVPLFPGEITAQAIELDHLPLRHLKKRDVLELKTKTKPDWGELFRTKDDLSLYNNGWSREEDDCRPEEIAQEVKALVERLKATGYDEFDLLTLKLSKQLHFTVPEYSPIELWHLLTWMAPAILFVFLSAVCQAPLILVKPDKQ